MKTIKNILKTKTTKAVVLSAVIGCSVAGGINYNLNNSKVFALQGVTSINEDNLNKASKKNLDKIQEYVELLNKASRKTNKVSDMTVYTDKNCSLIKKVDLKVYFDMDNIEDYIAKPSEKVNWKPVLKHVQNTFKNNIDDINAVMDKEGFDNLEIKWGSNFYKKDYISPGTFDIDYVRTEKGNYAKISYFEYSNDKSKQCKYVEIKNGELKTVRDKDIILLVDKNLKVAPDKDFNMKVQIMNFLEIKDCDRESDFLMDISYQVNEKLFKKISADKNLDSQASKRLKSEIIKSVSKNLGFYKINDFFKIEKIDDKGAYFYI